jgi:hypothetical protein
LSPSKSKTDRLSCRIRKDLLDWVRWYARQRGTTVTRLVVNFFEDLKKRNEADSMNEVDQF